MADPYRVVMKRRTKGERVAYLQGHLSALGYAKCMDGISPETKARIEALEELHRTQLAAERAAERDV